MIIDILVAVVLLLSCLIAFLRGFIRELLTIFGTGGALIAAYYGGPVLSPVLRGWFGVEEGKVDLKLFDIVPYSLIADVLSYGCLFIVVIVVLSLISHAVAEAAKKVGLGAIDRTLGVIFGLARGVLLLGLLYLPVHLLVDQETKDRWFEHSRAHLYMEVTANWIGGFLPKDAFDDVAGSTEGAREKLKDMNLLQDPQEGLKSIQDAMPDGVNIKKLLDRQTNADGDLNEEGYNKDFRDNMDKLFETKSADPVRTQEEVQ